MELVTEMHRHFIMSSSFTEHTTSNQITMYWFHKQKCIWYGLVPLVGSKHNSFPTFHITGCEQHDSCKGNDRKVMTVEFSPFSWKKASDISCTIFKSIFLLILYNIIHISKGTKVKDDEWNKEMRLISNESRAMTHNDGSKMVEDHPLTVQDTQH